MIIVIKMEAGLRAITPRGEQNKYEREKKRETDREGRDTGEGECWDIRRKDKTLRYRGREPRVVSEWKRTKESVSVMERGRVREAVTCEWCSEALWQEAVNAAENRKERKRGRGDKCDMVSKERVCVQPGPGTLLSV